MTIKDFPNLQFEYLRGGVFLSVPHSNRHEDCSCVNCCGDFFGIYIRLSHFSLHGFRKRAVLVPNNSKSEK